MKVGFFLGNTSYQSGLYNATKDVARCISGHGISVRYIFWHQRETMQADDDLINIWGLSKHKLSSRLFRKLSKSLLGYSVSEYLFSRLYSRQLEKFIKESGYDIVFFHGLNFVPFHSYKGKSYVVIHSCKYDNLITRRTGIKKIFYHKLYQHLYSGKNILSVSNSARDDMVEKLRARPNSIETIYNGFDFGKLEVKSNQPCNIALPERFIMAAGRADRTKRFDILIEAYSQTKAKNQHKLVIFGDGKYITDLKKLAIELDLADRIIFQGFVSPLNPIYKHASLYVLSSDIEGLPTVIIESLIAKTPVVATNAGGVNELLTGKLNDFVCEKGDIESLARNIDKSLALSLNVSYKDISFLDVELVAMNYIEKINALVTPEQIPPTTNTNNKLSSYDHPTCNTA